MTNSDLEKKIKALEAKLEQVAAEAQRSADMREIAQVQSRYMYYLEAGYISRVWEDLYSRSPNVKAEICDAGVWEGSESVKRLWMGMNAGGKDMIRLRGNMHTLFIATPYIVIGKDGKRAKGMWHIFGPHAMDVTPYPGDQHKLTAYWFFGKYDNEYVKENGEWKILSLHAVVYFRTPYDQGWVRQPDCRRTPAPPSAPPDKFSSISNTIYCPDGLNLYLPHIPEEF
jgi:hypothetical protein